MTITRKHRPEWIRQGIGVGCAVFTLLAADAAAALDLSFPGTAEMTASRSESLTSIRLPTGPFSNQGLPLADVEGSLQVQAFRLDLARASTLEEMQSLRAQIVAAGFTVQFECDTLICGGYDFRYGIEVLPEPDMHVDLGDFRYLAARKGGGAATEHLGLLVSRFGQTGFVQLTVVGGAEVTVRGSKPGTKAPAAPSDPPQSRDDGFANRLLTGQPQVLDDLVFASGSSSLANGTYASLTALADWLRADPNRKIVLVGHTDASGTLEGNIKLSKLRAESVRHKLLSEQNIAPTQVQAEGVGFLAPRDSNMTAEGRRKNRRVEVMMTSTDGGAP